MLSDFERFVITAEDGLTKAEFVPARGGMMSSLIMPGNEGATERLYQHDFIWDDVIDDLPGGWPFLFPVCARLERNGKRGEYEIEGKIYHLPIHGLSWNRPWDVVAKGAHFIELVLRDTPETRAQYPFHFEVRLRYELKPGELICAQYYKNTGNKPMPYNAGFHPYFLTPKEKAQVTLQYEPLTRLVYNDTLTDIIGEAPLFSLPTAVNNPEINEQLTRVGKNKKIILSFPNGDQLEMVAEGVEDPDLFPYIQLYTMKDKPFVCVEPWMGFPNAMNASSGMRWLAPGKMERGILHLRLRNRGFAGRKGADLPVR